MLSQYNSCVSTGTAGMVSMRPGKHSPALIALSHCSSMAFVSAFAS